MALLFSTRTACQHQEVFGSRLMSVETVITHGMQGKELLGMDKAVAVACEFRRANGFAFLDNNGTADATVYFIPVSHE